MRPTGLKRPGMMQVDPRKAAAKAGQLISDARHRVRRALSAGIEDASQSAEESRSDKAGDADAIGVDAAEARHFASATDEENAPADRGIFEQVPDKSREDDRVVELERNAEQPIDDDRIHERGRNSADRHRVAEPKRCAMQECARAKRDDQRVNPENGDQETVDETDRDPQRKRRDHGPADANLVVDVEDRDQHRRHRHDERDRKIEIVGRERNDEPERDHDENRLGAEDRREIGPGQERVRPQIAEHRDQQKPDDDQAELLEPVDKRRVRHTLDRGWPPCSGRCQLRVTRSSRRGCAPRWPPC